MRSRACHRVSAPLLAVLLLGASARAQERGAPAPAAEMERARRAYDEGLAAYRLGRFDEAARRFEDSYRVTRFPTLLFDIAQAYRRLYETGKSVEALRKSLDLYRGFLREAPADAAKRPLAEKFLATLEAALAAEGRRQREELLERAAGREGLALAEKLVADGALGDAGLVLDRVLASRHNPREVIVAALQKRGAVHGRLGQTAPATLAFQRALALDPGLQLADGSDAATVAALAAARRYWTGKRPLAIAHIPVGDASRGKPARIAVTLESDPLQMVRRVAVLYRTAGAGAYSTVRAEGPTAPAAIPAQFLAGLRAGARVEYYVVALDENDGELVTLGSPAQPFVLAVSPAPGELPTEPRGRASGRAWYRTWWVWAIAGSVAAAAGVGIYFAARPSGHVSIPVFTE